MYKGFNLTLEENFFSDFLLNSDDIQNYKQRDKTEIRSKVKELINEEGIISAGEIVEDWFKDINADVFISHSHMDEYLAIKLAFWIERNMELKVFIDSCAWGNFSDLARDFNDNFSKNKSNSFYEYDKAQKVFAHTNTILNTSLTKMIDKCEVVFFLNTENSINSSEFHKISTTFSPWIYHELLITKLIHKRKPERIVPSLESQKHTRPIVDGEDILISYDPDIEHLCKVSEIELESWKTKNNSKNYSIHALDVLYSLIEDKI